MTKLLFKFVPFRGSFITENCSIYYWSAGDVMAAMLVVKKKVFLSSGNTLKKKKKKKKRAELTTNMAAMSRGMQRINQIVPMLLRDAPLEM